MKVFTIMFNGGEFGDAYGGGMAVVAANTETEAYNLMSDKFNYPDDGEPDSPYNEFRDYYANIDGIEEHPELNTTLTEPQVIAFNFYRE